MTPRSRPLIVSDRSGPMTRILADLEELEDLGHALSHSRTAVADLEDVTRLGSDVSGSPEVTDALADVAGDWDQRRQRLTSALATLAAYTEAASQAFADADATIVTVAVED